MKIERAQNSCGIKEFEGMGTKKPEVIMAEVWDEMRTQNGAFVTFSNPLKYKNIKQLAKYIEKNIGKIVYLERKNPNSGNTIGVVIWYYDKKKFAEWREKNDSLFPPVRKFKVLKNTCYHSAEIGSIVTFDRWSREDRSFFFQERGGYITLSDVAEIK